MKRLQLTLVLDCLVQSLGTLTPEGICNWKISFPPCALCQYCTFSPLLYQLCALRSWHCKLT